jgi:hypothetical protein
LKKQNKESGARYAFCPLLAVDGNERAGFVIDEIDLANVSDTQTTMVDRRTGKRFRVCRIRHRGAEDHLLLCEAD